MSPNTRIFLNIVATYGRLLYCVVCGLFTRVNGVRPIEAMIACARGCAVRQGIRRKKRHVGLLKKRK